MNSDGAASPSSPSVSTLTSTSTSTSTSRRIRVRSLKQPSISQGVGLPSIPSDDNDNEWVSPFTLPPLPTFKKQRIQLDRSPEDRIHNRSGSSAYYAAAWGSPYATPSPHRSPAPRVNRNKSLDLESSPLSARKFNPDQLTSAHARQFSLPAQDSIKPTDLHTPASPIDAQDQSSRRNWLSESEDSGSELDKAIGKTPTRRTLVSHDTAVLSVRSHHVQGSVDTVTPETFNGASSIRATDSVTQQPLDDMAEIIPAPPSPAEDKPLPNLPSEPVASSNEVRVESRPTLPVPMQSFQRPKKKVPWNGKSCIIALPLTDRGQAGLPPVLTQEEREVQLQKWIDLGYPIHGFSVGGWLSPRLLVGGASRPTFPDEADIQTERKSTLTNVRMPNQAEWDAWVEYLKEEKLRALGVTPSTSEAPLSTQSPFSSNMSRVSSTYPSVVPSPPIPALSAASARAAMSQSPFSSTGSHPMLNGFSNLSQRGTPGLPNGRPMHGYTQSIAIPGMGQRYGSPFDYPVTQPGAFGTGMRSPEGQMPGMRPWSPGHVQNMQSMVSLVSPVNPSPQDYSRVFSSNPQVQAIQRQQEALMRQQQEVQARIAHHHRQMSMFPLRTMSAEQVHQLPRTPKAPSPEREPPEIMQPTPRTHRHNLSAALEKGVTESVVNSSKELTDAVSVTERNNKHGKTVSEEVENGDAVENEEQEELPILHRPETIKEADEKDEIETNPSIAGTPLLLDDKNPFTNFKPLLPSAPPDMKRPGFGHSAQPSLTRLNVQAKEFSPSKATFSPSGDVFNFDGDAFASNDSSPGRSVASGPRFGHKHNPSSLGLNVTAPVFTPSFGTSIKTEQSRTVSHVAESPTELKAEATAEESGLIPLEENTQESGPVSADGPTIEVITKAKPTFDLESSILSFAGDNLSHNTTPAKSTFDPRSSTFNFTSGIKSQDATPAKSTFDPGSSVMSTFSFGSPAFNVDAPEFKPSGFSRGSLSFTPDKPQNFTGSIFSDVVIDASSKSERRNKAVTIMKPNSRESSVVPEQQETFDSNGRLEAPADRNKRARTVNCDDEEILFADSAPFTSLADEADETEEHEAQAAETEAIEPPEEALLIEEETLGKPETLINAGSVADDHRAGSDPTPETVKETDADAKSAAVTNADVFPERNEESEPLPEDARPSSTQLTVDEAAKDMLLVNNTESETLQAVVNSAELVEEPQPALEGLDQTLKEPVSKPQLIETTVEDITANHSDTVEKETPLTPIPVLSADAPAFQPSSSLGVKPDSGLSALAPSFDFRAGAGESVPAPKLSTPPPQQSASKPKKGGLMASRFASSPTPQSKSPEMVERNSSPPQQLFGLKEVEAPEASTQVEADPTRSLPIETEIPEELNEVASQQDDIFRTLEKYREHSSRSASVVSRAGDLSIEEINAVMKQFEDDPDLGVIREDTPAKETPLIDMRFPQQFRSDAPSPSPNRRLDRPFDPAREAGYSGLGFEMSGVHQLNYGGSGEVSDWNAELSPGQQDKLEARAHFFDDHVNDLVDNILESRLAPLERALLNIQNSVQQVNASKPRVGRRSMSTENKESDADDEDGYDAYEGYTHYRSRSPGKRDRRQEKLKAAILEAMTVAQSTVASQQVDVNAIQSVLDEMRELTQRSATQPAQPVVDLSDIHEALSELKTFAQQKPEVAPVDTSELIRAIAEMKMLAQQRAAEPQLDVLAMHAALKEIRDLAAQKPTAPPIDLSEFRQALMDLKDQADVKAKEQPSDLKAVFEEVISTHPKLRQIGGEQERDSNLALQSKIEDLQAMLKVAEKRADGEAALRREAEEENDNLHRHLKDVQDQVTLHKATSEESQKNLKAFLQEKQDYHRATDELRDVRLKNEALEKTLDGYRDFKEQMKEELETERSRSDSLARSLQDARSQHRDQMDSRDFLREQVRKIQERMVTVMQDIKHDESEWRKREHDLMAKNQLLQAALDHETNRRARIELESEKLTKEHRESLGFRSKHESAQDEVSRLAAIIVQEQANAKSSQNAAYRAERELAFTKEKQAEIIASQTARLQDELDVSNTRLQNLQSDADARIARLQGYLDSAAVELHESKAKHESNIEKMFENHNAAIRGASEKHAAELEQRLAMHEERLTDLRNQHDRDIKNAHDDRGALEERYVGKLDLSDDKISHLEDKVRDLEERLEISNQAARAAVAAAAKHVNLPTPASSVVASPPHRASIGSASMSIARGSELPEKISPQALRETIMVLQDQLQNREQKIDRLEAELASIDKDAPTTVKERDTEIVMLRELLDVRVDDLQELIATLEKPDYNKGAVKDAAIRLKTQIKMEQQLKERAITGANLASNLPSSISSGLANLAQSPRAMVAAAAWGNWRKVRDSTVGNVVSDFATNMGSQTPSRASSTSSGALGSIMTPPVANKSPTENARPLAAAAARRNTGPGSPSAGARPLRAFNSQARTLSSARLARRGTNESLTGSSGSAFREISSMKVEPPSTPLHLAMESDFGDDVDDDASPLDGKDQGFESDYVEEPVQPEPTPVKARSRRTSKASAGKLVSPRTSRSSAGKPVSPRALRALAGHAGDDVVEVIEED